MMKLTIALLIFFSLFFSTAIYSQNNVIDSLKHVLSLNTQKDTTRVIILNKLAFSYYRIDTEKTIAYIEEAEKLSDSINYKNGKARSLYLKGKTHQSQSNYPEAIAQYNKTLLVYEELNNWVEIAKCYAAIGFAFHYSGEFNNSIINLKKSIEVSNKYGTETETALPIKFIGYNYLDMGNYDLAHTYYDKALAINIKYNDKLEISSCNLNIGSVFLKKGKYPTALEYYNRSLKISEEIKDTIGIAKALNNIGIIYDTSNNYDQALRYYNRALVIQKKLGTQRNVAKGLGNLGLVYFGKEDFTNALSHYNEAIKISKEINDRDSQARYLTYIGNVYMRLEDHTIAIYNYKEAIKINKELGDKLGLCYSFKLLAESYYLQKKYKDAILNARECNRLANKLKALSFQRDSYDLLAKLYELTGNYKKALDNNKLAKIYNDTLFNKKNIEKIAQLEYEYKYKQALDSANIRELQLTQRVKTTSLDLEKSQRNLLQGVIAFLILAIIAIGIIFFLKLRNEKAKTQNIVIEQKLLRSQMTPHFIFNSLSVLQGMILNKEESKSVSYLSKFSKLLRTTLESSRYKLVPLSDELSALESYIALQNLDVTPPFNYTVTVDSEINQTALNIPPMLIQPFIENAIEHAFPIKKDDKEISISISFKNKKLVCTIIDNGIGINEGLQKTKTKKNSLATTITSERLKMLSKDFKVRGSVTIEDRYKYKEQGTIVILVLPYKIEQV